MFCIIFLLIESGGLQIVVFSISNLVIFAYNGAIQPKKTREANWWMLAEEYIILLTSSLIFCFSEFLEPEARYILGWMLCAVLSAYVLASILH